MKIKGELRTRCQKLSNRLKELDYGRNLAFELNKWNVQCYTYSTTHFNQDERMIELNVTFTLKKNLIDKKVLQ